LRLNLIVLVMNRNLIHKSLVIAGMIVLIILSSTAIWADIAANGVTIHTIISVLIVVFLTWKLSYEDVV
jgi:hypothetical protein